MLSRRSPDQCLRLKSHNRRGADREEGKGAIAQNITLLLRNEGPSTAFLAFGNAGVVATAGGVVNAANDGSFPILAGEISTVRVDASGAGLNVAGITAAGTATVRITRGSGV